MKTYAKSIILIITSINFLLSFELPWDKVSVGVMGDLGSSTSATFNTDNILYGLDAMTIGATLEVEGQEASASACIFMPKAGYRFNLRSKDRIGTYYSAEVYLAIPFISLEVDGSDSEFEEMIDETTDQIEDIIDNLGIKVGYGIEYKFNNQLSLSTDVGFNYLLNTIDSIEGLDLKTRMGNTFTKLSLNFSF